MADSWTIEETTWPVWWWPTGRETIEATAPMGYAIRREGELIGYRDTMKQARADVRRLRHLERTRPRPQTT